MKNGTLLHHLKMSEKVGFTAQRPGTWTFDNTILWQKYHKIIENLKIVESHEIRNIHATFLAYLHNFVTSVSQFCGIRVKIFCRFTIFRHFATIL